MADGYQADTAPIVDEGSWIYLIALTGEQTGDSRLHERVVEVCEASGWSAISWSPGGAATRGADPGRFFEGVRHAVEHADVVIALIGDGAGTADAELALAYSHRRPIIGLRLSGQSETTSGVQAMLENYERARVVTCSTPDECASALRAAFSEPGFAETIRRAAGEYVGNA